MLDVAQKGLQGIQESKVKMVATAVFALKTMYDLYRGSWNGLAVDVVVLGSVLLISSRMGRALARDVSGKVLQSPRERVAAEEADYQVSPGDKTPKRQGPM